jgi:hypothetical protein
MKTRRGRKQYRGGHPIQFVGVPGVININPTGAADTWGNLIDGIRDFLKDPARGSGRHTGNFVIRATLPNFMDLAIQSQDEENYDDKAIAILPGSIIQVDISPPIYGLFIERSGVNVPFGNLDPDYYEEGTTYGQLITELKRMYDKEFKATGEQMNLQTVRLRVRHANGRVEDYDATSPKVDDEIQQGDVIVIVDKGIDKLTEGVKDPSFNTAAKYVRGQNDPGRDRVRGGKTRKHKRNRRR